MSHPARKEAPIRLIRIMIAALIALTWLPVARGQAPAQPSPPSATPPSLPSAPPDVEGAPLIHSDVNLVVLRASVLDQRGKFVTGIGKQAFQVFEDKAAQTVSLFSEDDVPASVGLVIDNSGSMRSKRPQVDAAALTLVKTSNPEDEVFVVNFDEGYYFDTPGDFTSDLGELKQALTRVQTAGATALYDAVVASAGHLKKGTRSKKALVVVTDGADNSSRHNLADAIRAAQHADAQIYAIGLFDAGERKEDPGEFHKARHDLTRMAEETGGMAFFIESADNAEAICTQVAHIIRDQYTLGYYSTNPKQDGTYRTLRVLLAPSTSSGKLSVRTRSGYYAERGQ